MKGLEKESMKSFSKIMTAVCMFITFYGCSFTQPGMDLEFIDSVESDPNYDGEELESPEYARLVYETIKKNAYRYHESYALGEVFLRFELTSKGKLRKIMVVRSKTAASDDLIIAAVTAVRKSAPFPRFPRDLADKFEWVSFNITFNYRDAQQRPDMEEATVPAQVLENDGPGDLIIKAQWPDESNNK